MGKELPPRGVSGLLYQPLIWLLESEPCTEHLGSGKRGLRPPDLLGQLCGILKQLRLSLFFVVLFSVVCFAGFLLCSWTAASASGIFFFSFVSTNGKRAGSEHSREKEPGRSSKRETLLWNIPALGLQQRELGTFKKKKKMKRDRLQWEQVFVIMRPCDPRGPCTSVLQNRAALGEVSWWPRKHMSQGSSRNEAPPHPPPPTSLMRWWLHTQKGWESFPEIERLGQSLLCSGLPGHSQKAGAWPGDRNLSTPTLWKDPGSPTPSLLSTTSAAAQAQPSFQNCFLAPLPSH